MIGKDDLEAARRRGLGVFYVWLFAADDRVYAVRSNGTTYVIVADLRRFHRSIGRPPDRRNVSTRYGLTVTNPHIRSRKCGSTPQITR
jgi:hypothetical protein